MIDIENLVYTNVRAAVKLRFPASSVSGTYVDVPSSFPHVSIEETDNASVPSTISTSDREYATNVTFTVNIYTNTATAKSDAKALGAVVNDTFTDMGFARSMYQQMPNIDRTIYRLVLRFQATVWKSADGAADHFNITAR